MNIVLPKYTSIDKLQKDLIDKKITCSDLAEYYLNRIEQTKQLNIYISVYRQTVLQEALRQDDLISQNRENELGKLFGVFINHKDVICYQGAEITAGSKILEGFESLYTATGLSRLLEEGALLIGRVNCDEFAMGSSNENSIYGPTKNPYNESFIPGGSSGACAVSVASDTCLASLGSDTGGSVRQPASFCGVYGFKPTYGAISRYGLIAYGSSFDQIGFMSHSISCCSFLLEITRGIDPMDATSIEIDDKPKITKNKLTFGYFNALDRNDFLHPDIAKSFKNYKQALLEKGHTLVPLDFPLFEYLVPAYYILCTAEASTNLSRYDGIRYGHRAKIEKNADIQTLYKQSRTEGFGPEVKRRLMMGTYVLSAGYYEAYFGKAQKVRQLVVKDLEKCFEKVDFILNPVTPNMPWEIGNKTDNPVQIYLSDVLTVYANLAGLPSISIPWAKGGNNLPIGMQFTAPRKADFDLMELVQDLAE